MKKYLVIFFAPILLELLTWWIRGFSTPLCSVVQFVLFAILTYMLIKRYDKSISPLLILVIAILGASIFDIPTRIMYWDSTLHSLPNAIMVKLGCLIGYTIYKVGMKWKITIASLSVIFCLWSYFFFWDLFHDKLTYGSFFYDGLVESSEKYDFNLIDENGENVPLSSFEGKVVVFNFWGEH